jgi:hypothetical protein
MCCSGQERSIVGNPASDHERIEAAAVEAVNSLGLVPSPEWRDVTIPERMHLRMDLGNLATAAILRDTADKDYFLIIHIIADDRHAGTLDEAKADALRLLLPKLQAELDRIKATYLGE